MIVYLVQQNSTYCDVFRDLVQFEEHPWRSVTFSKVAEHSSMGVFQVFKIVQMVPNCTNHRNCFLK